MAACFKLAAASAAVKSFRMAGGSKLFPASLLIFVANLKHSRARVPALPHEIAPHTATFVGDEFDCLKRVPNHNFDAAR